jgi:septation ring formation regulator EzrA
MEKETTVSINGGPEVTMDVLREALDKVVGNAAADQFPNLKVFFAELDRREEEITAIREEMNAVFDSYCSHTGTNKEALKLGYKLYEGINKDKHKAEVMQFEYDKLASLLIPETDTWKQEPLL